MFSTEIKKLQEIKKEKAQLYLRKIDRIPKTSIISIGPDSNSSANSSSVSGLRVI